MIVRRHHSSSVTPENTSPRYSETRLSMAWRRTMYAPGLPKMVEIVIVNDQLFQYTQNFKFSGRRYINGFKIHVYETFLRLFAFGRVIYKQSVYLV